MTTPTAPADPAPAPAPAPNGTAPAPAAPPDPSAASVAKLESTLAEVRGELKDAKQALATAQQASMSDQEKQIAVARAEGKAEAAKEAAERLAAAEFRIAAAGRLANPEAALAMLDMAKLVQKNGEPNRQAIAALVEQLAPQQAQQPGGGHVIPTGPRTASTPAADGDWLRQVQRGPRRGSRA
jgi:ribosomal protein L17